MSKFQQRHYEAIASLMKETTPVLNGKKDWIRDPDRLDHHYDLIKKFCEFFAADNPNFKPDKFTKACSSE